MPQEFDFSFPAIVHRDISLDPKKTTAVGFVPSGATQALTISGQWRTGSTDHWVGPTGDSTVQVAGANKGAAVIWLFTVSASPFQLPQRVVYGGSPITIAGAAFATAVTVVCNDENLEDNDSNPSDPMKATLA